eukprot:g16009.t1
MIRTLRIGKAAIWTRACIRRWARFWLAPFVENDGLEGVEVEKGVEVENKLEVADGIMHEEEEIGIAG